MQYIVTYDRIFVKNGKTFVEKDISIKFADRDLANEIWSNLKKDNMVHNIRTSKVEDELFYATVCFGNGTKSYLYLADRQYKKGDKVVVAVQDYQTMELYYKEATIVESGKKTEDELNKLYPVTKLKYVIGYAYNAATA